ncbi:MAG: RNA polymerase sigma factor [Planctomycetaceae bacterium]
MTDAEDSALVAAFRTGRGDAFEAIVRRHHAGLLRIADLRCGGGAMAEEAVQTALIRAHGALRRAGAVENLGAWLRRVVQNCATDLLAGRRAAPAPLPEIAAPDAAPHAGLERTELRRMVSEAIQKLPDLYREPLTLHILEELEAREIAARLRENLHSIKSRLARGRRELRRRLEGVLARAGYR